MDSPCPHLTRLGQCQRELGTTLYLADAHPFQPVDNVGLHTAFTSATTCGNDSPCSINIVEPQTKCTIPILHTQHHYNIIK